MQYFLTYNLGLDRDPGAKAKFGSSVHKVLEVLAALKLDSQNHKKPAISVNDDVVGNITIDRKHLLEESFLREITQSSLEYYMRDTGIDVSNRNKIKIKQDTFNTDKLIDSALSHTNGAFDPRKRTILHPEQSFSFEIKKEWARYKYRHLEGYLGIKGTIDLVTELDDGGIEIIDWKTGKRLDWASGEEKDYKKLCTDPQLMLYYYAARKLYPNAPYIMLTIFFIRDGGPFTIMFEDEHLVEMENILRKKFKYVQENVKPRMVSSDQSSFKCKYICDYFKNKWPGSDKNQCQFIHDEIKNNGIDYVVSNHTNPKFTLGHYQQPGE